MNAPASHAAGAAPHPQRLVAALAVAAARPLGQAGGARSARDGGLAEEGGLTLGEGRDVLVTRPVCANGCTPGAVRTDPVCPDFRNFELAGPPPVCAIGGTFDDSAEFFIDWLTITQNHPEGGLPQVDCGAVWATDEQGDVKWRTVRRVVHEGSFETSVSVRCDGFRVELSGNVGRFGRPDNVFGFGLVECLRKANEVLSHYGLPPFTSGRQWHRVTKRGIQSEWTGARISRIDLTSNFEAGSADNATATLRALAQQHKSKQRGRTSGEGETVDWGRGSRRQYWKAYNKANELKVHGCTDERLIEHCREVGLVRFEGTVRSNALTDLGAAFLGDYERGWGMAQLIRLFAEASEVLQRAEKTTDDLDELPRPLRATARDYLAGMDMRLVLKRRTFYLHRKSLLPYGLDIAMTNLAPFKPRVQVITLKPAARPDWYRLAA